MKAFSIWAAIAVLATPTVFGQRMMGGGPRDLGTSQMAKIFGKNQAFTATADVTTTGKEAMQTVMPYAFLKGNMRTEMDMGSMKGAHMSPQAAAQMKQMGMDRIITIYRSDKKQMYLVYPGLKSYCEMSSGQKPKSEAKEPKTEVVELGKETVDGHPCVKNKITTTNDEGKSQETLTWQATDLNDFPVKTEMQIEGTTITTVFRDIKLTAPEAALFDPPSEYQRYGSMQEMMMQSMQRMMGGGQ